MELIDQDNLILEKNVFLRSEIEDLIGVVIIANFNYVSITDYFKIDMV